MKMPFGKHAGMDVEQLPDSYLQWLFWQDFLKPELEDAVKIEIVCRWPEKINVQVVLDQPRRQPKKKIKAELQSAYRDMARRFHPDVGGSTRAMQAVNEFWEAIQKRLNV
jgi:uncharacterized protein (DUF3820 family)